MENPVVLDDNSDGNACHLAINCFLGNWIQRPAGHKNNERGGMHDKPPFKCRCLPSDEVSNIDSPSKAMNLDDDPAEPSNEDGDEPTPPLNRSDIDDDDNDNDEWQP